MKTVCIAIICILTLFHTTSAQEFSTVFKASKKWLVLPVKNGAPKRNIELWVDGEKERYFDIELADAMPDWFAYLDISAWKGMDIEFRINKKNITAIEQSDEDKNALPLYNEKLRGQFHFSPKRGWMNDPNGMVYYNGEYHLFFQHNPYGVEWGNMHWGHAVSKDMLHWKETGEALYPDKFGTMFSGSAIVDSFNTSGLGKQALVMFFTGAGSWGQGLAWSTDGHTFKKLDRTVVHRINKDNRDPKVIWHEPTKKWVMVLYVERDKEQHSMQFLTSPDLRNWTKTSTINGGIGNDRYLFECPEFFELPVEGNPSQKKWILVAANSEYAIGTFDGITFKPETERLSGQRGRDFYAAQTFNNEPTGRRIEIGWWRTNTNKEGMNFNQAMSIPMELKLVNTAQGLRLTRTPVKELETLREKEYVIKPASIKEGSPNPLSAIHAELLEIRTAIEPGKAQEVKLDIHGLPIVYDVAKQQLQINGINAPAPLVNGKLDLIIYVDRIGVEVFTADGLLFMPVNVNIDASKKTVALSVKGGTAKLKKMTVYELKSTW